MTAHSTDTGDVAARVFPIEQTRHIAAQLCGRGLYHATPVWETADL
ncbi:hypothetical protein [Nocardia abscessus]|nr:hypothetical protein [Nocardia abscessus]